MEVQAAPAVVETPQAAPPRVSRYRSVRQAQHAQHATNHAQSVPAPPLPVTLPPASLPQTRPSSHEPSIETHLATSPPQPLYPVRTSSKRLRNGTTSPSQASAGHLLVKPPAAAGSSQISSELTTSLAIPADGNPEKGSVQRSMSRYHRKNKPNIASAQPGTVAATLTVPSIPHHVGPQTYSRSRRQPESPMSGFKHQQEVAIVVKEQSTQPPRLELKQSAQSIPPISVGAREPPMPPLLSSSAPPVVFAPPQIIIGNSATEDLPSKSRYRRQASPHSPTGPRGSPVDTVQERQSSPAPSRQHAHSEAMRRLQKQASFPSQSRPSPRLLTKASLDQLPDDTRDSANAAMQLRVSHINAQAFDGRTTEQQYAARAQNEVKKLLDSEARRQQKVRMTLRADKMKAEHLRAEEQAREERRRQADEDHARRERQLEERERQLEEREKRAKHEENLRAAQALADLEARREAGAQKAVGSDHPVESSRGRRDGREERVDRHRKRSLSALEGKPTFRSKSRDDVPPVPPPPPLASDSKASFGGLLKKRKPKDAPKPQTIDRSKSQGKVDERNIKQYGGDLVPGVDAPISAVNAGERRVLVACNKSSLLLPVLPTTTSIDLMRSAATCMTESIDANATVLLESFGKVGVQRPLRRYEHVRNVMNSWDDDEQNSLIIVPSATKGDDKDLQAATVSMTQPVEFSCALYYSQKPGKWDKRWITLRSDGQILYAKSGGHKETTNICHLTDFDIYSPESSSQGRRIKPPKKFCFAIKSQQRSIVFESLETFVHFFSTSDKRVAGDFYKAVQGWRSWYLVNVLGEGRRSDGSMVDHQTTSTGDLLRSASRERDAHQRKESHYQLGSFKPLLDLKSLGLSSDRPTSRSDKQGASDHIRQQSSKGDGPPSAFPKWLIDSIDSGTNTGQSRDNLSSPTHGHTNSVQRNASIEREASQQHPRGPSGQGQALMDPKLNANIKPADSTFAPTGLLGRSYSTRQKAQDVREAATKTNSPFLHGGLLESAGTNGKLNSRSNPAVDTADAAQTGPPSDLTRSGTRRGQPASKPLVDLAPQASTDATHHVHKGQGFVPSVPGSGGLIDNATSPDNANTTAPSMDWRVRPSTRGRDGTAHAQDPSSGTSLPPSRDKSGKASDDIGSPVIEKDNPFTSTGLLANSREGWSTQTQGRGNMDGSKAVGPMLDVSEASMYAKGSLLHKEAMERPRELVIDRSRGVEVRVGTGEAA